MSNQRNVFGVVLVTVCLTSTVLVAGYFGVSRYFVQQTATAPAAEPAPAAPAPRRKAPRAKKNAAADAATADPAAAATSASGSEPAVARTATEPAPAAEQAPAPVPQAEPQRPAVVEAVAQTPVPAPVEQADARSVMAEAQRRAEARTYYYDGLLESFDGSKKLAEKRWTFDREGSNGRSKAVIRFTSPPEVKGVALLIFNHPDRASDQWMWTPAIERDRRIATQDRSTRFFGTDFSFEDLEERDVDQYDYTMMSAESIDGAPCWKIKSTPKKSRTSQYSHSIAWVRKDNYAVVKLENFADGQLVRRLNYGNLENVQGIWTARELDMWDVKRNTHTRLSLQDVKYNAAMKDEKFTLEAIRR